MTLPSDQSDSPRVELIISDRYSAAGIPYPDPATVCPGPCEGMGFYPENDPLRWEEGAIPDEIGYVFQTCPICKGTGKRSDAS